MKYLPLRSTFCLNLIIPNNYNSQGLIFGGGGLYREGVFHYKSWFLNIPGLIHVHGRAYYQNFMVTTCKGGGLVYMYTTCTMISIVCSEVLLLK